MRKLMKMDNEEEDKKKSREKRSGLRKQIPTMLCFSC